ncbi:MAG: hemagglutinin repeat-containing protein [Fusobacteriaceae bacterium]
MDAKALGSMYSGRIFLVSTEAGVGVNSSGEMLASAGDVKIDVNGNISFATIQAKSNVDIKGKDVSVTKSLVATNNINLDVTNIKNSGDVTATNINIKGNVSGNTGNIVSKENLYVTGNVKNENYLEAKKIDVKGNFSNSKDVLALVNMYINGSLNNGGHIQSADFLSVGGKVESNSGSIFSKDIALKGDVNSSGNLYSLTNLVVSGSVINYGNIQVNNSAIFTGKVENRNGFILSKDIQMKSDFLNFGGLYSLTNLSILGNTSNSGDIQVDGILDFSGKVENSNGLIFSNVITVGKGLINSGSNSYITALDSLVINGGLQNTLGNIFSNKVDVSGKVINSGEIQSSDTLKINGDTTNYGIIASGKDLSITGNIINSGTFSATNVTMSGGSFSNTSSTSGLVGNNVALYFSSIINNGDISGRDILHLKGDNFNGALSSSRILSEKLVKIDMTNSINNSGSIYSNKIFLATLGITNNSTATLISEDDLDLTMINTINNLGKISSNGNLTFGTITNSGAIVAQKNINFNKQLTNTATGSIASGGDLNNLIGITTNGGIIAAGGTIDLKNINNNNGSIYGSGTIKLEAFSNNNGLVEGQNITITNAGILDNQDGIIKAFYSDSAADTVNSSISITASQGIINNSTSRIISQGFLTLGLIGQSFNLDNLVYKSNGLFKISANTLSSSGYTNYGGININLTGDFINTSSIKSYGILSINATSIYNENNAILTSLGSMELKGTNINNLGRIETNDKLTIKATNFTNNKNRLVYSTNDMSFDGIKSFTNYGHIFSYNNMKINASGGEVLNVATSDSEATIEAGGDLTINAKNINNIGFVELLSVETQNSLESELKNPPSQGEIENNADGDGADGWLDSQWNFVSATKVVKGVVKEKRATIKSKGSLDITAEVAIKNIDADIFADKDMNITANELINKASTTYSAETSTWNRRYKTCTIDSWWITSCNHQNWRNSTVTRQTLLILSTSNIISGGNLLAKIAGNITNGFLPSGEGGTSSEGIAKAGDLSGKTINITQAKIDDVIRSGTTPNIIITLPAGSNGMFVVNPKFTQSNLSGQANVDYIMSGTPTINPNLTGEKPKFSYMIETNVDFIDPDKYYGSNYFFSRINFNPDKEIKLIGDPYYETEFVNKSILNSTNTRYLAGATNETEQMKMLQDNALAQMSNLNLSIGVSLNPEQIKNLKTDIVWYVEKEVNGSKVLVPQVFFCPETLLAMSKTNTGGGGIITAGGNIDISGKNLSNSGNISAKGNVNINVDSLLNQSIGNSNAGISGGTIKIVSVNDIINRGASITGAGAVSLTSTYGSITNESMVGRFGSERNYSDRITNLASISGGTVGMFAANDITNIGANLSSSGALTLSGTNVIIKNVELESHSETGDDKNWTKTTAIKNIGSNVSGGSVSIDAKNDINLIGSNLSGGDIALSAGNDVNIESVMDSVSTESGSKKTEKKKKGFNASTKTTTTVSQNYDETNVSSKITSGGNLTIKAKNNVTAIGSDIIALGDTSLEAGNDVKIMDAVEKDWSATTTKTTSTSGSIGLDGAKVEQKFKTEKKEDYDETSKGSTIFSGGNLKIKAKNDVTVQGSNIISMGDTELEAGRDVNILAAVENDRSSTSTEEITLSVDVKLSSVEGKAKYEKQKQTEASTNVSGSNLISNGNLKIKAGGATTLESANVMVKEDIEIDTGSLNVSAKEATRTSTSESASVEIAVKGDVTEGVTISGKLAASKDKNGLSTEVGSSISGNNIKLKTNNGGMNFVGASVTAINDMELDSAGDINIRSAETKTKSSSVSGSIEGEINVTTLQFKAAMTLSGEEKEGVTNSNSSFSAGNKLAVKGDDLNIKGGNLSGETTDIDVKNLNIQSVQDKEKGKSGTLTVAVGSTGASASGSATVSSKAWTSDQSGITGRSSSNIKVEGNTNIVGAVLGGANTTIDTGSLTYSDLKDEDKSTTVSFGASTGDNSSEDADKKKSSASGEFGFKDKEQATRATIGNGTIIVGGKKTDSGINRDESKSQEITKDVDRSSGDYVKAANNIATTGKKLGNTVGSLDSKSVNSVGGTLNTVGKVASDSSAALKSTSEGLALAGELDPNLAKLSDKVGKASVVAGQVGAGASAVNGMVDAGKNLGNNVADAAGGGFNSIQGSISTVGKVANTAKEGLTELNKSVGKLGEVDSSLAKYTDKVGNELDKATKVAGQVGAGAKATNVAIDAGGKIVESGKKLGNNVSNAAGGGFNSIKGSIDTVGNVANSAKEGLTDLNKSVGELGAIDPSLSKYTDKVGNKLGKATDIAGKVGTGAKVANAAVDAGDKIVESGKKLGNGVSDAANGGFGSMKGSLSTIGNIADSAKEGLGELNSAVGELGALDPSLGKYTAKAGDKLGQASDIAGKVGTGAKVANAAVDAGDKIVESGKELYGTAGKLANGGSTTEILKNTKVLANQAGKAIGGKAEEQITKISNKADKIENQIDNGLKTADNALQTGKELYGTAGKLANGGSTTEILKNTKVLANQAGKAIGGKAKEEIEKINGKVDEAKETVNNAVEKGKNAGNKIIDTANKEIDNATNKVKAAPELVVQKGTEAKEKLIGQADNKIKKGTDKAKNIVSTAKDKTANLGQDKISKNTKNIADVAESEINKIVWKVSNTKSISVKKEDMLTMR